MFFQKSHSQPEGVQEGTKLWLSLSAARKHLKRELSATERRQAALTPGRFFKALDCVPWCLLRSEERRKRRVVQQMGD